MSNYDYKLTEEISRWAFEIHIHNNEYWDIIFTNPTAGPWKRLESKNKNGVKGEVYRFDRDEARPDIVLVNDKLNIMLIIEAKDSLKKLVKEDQVRKSCQVVVDMAKILKGIHDNEYWLTRHTYSIYNGLLWGAEEEIDTALISKAFGLYEKHLKGLGNIVSHKDMIGIETFRSQDKLTLRAHMHTESIIEKKIIESLSITSTND